MKAYHLGVVLWMLASVAVAQVAPSSGAIISSSSVPAFASSIAVMPAPIIQISPEALMASESTLTERHAAMVKRAVPVDADLQQKWQAWAAVGWSAALKVIDHDQAVVVVNRDPKVEQVAVMIAHPSAPWTLIGVSPTSTGQSGRVKHFITPTGVFDHDGSIMDYRALGTKNENGIRGIGAKGSRVWDFGWQDAQTGWLKRPEIRQIRMEMHATDPDYLEQRLGHPASEGCIRIGAGLNKFLDHYGILDEDYWSRAPTSVAIRALLPKGDQPTLPGRYVVIVDIPNVVQPDAEPAVMASQLSARARIPGTPPLAPSLLGGPKR